VIQLVIFDWDGTLMDSALKITRCIQASAFDLGLVEPSYDQSKVVIGLGLSEAMQRLFPNVSAAQTAQLVDAYKHHFLHTDKTEQALFGGVKEGLARINATGAMIAVATGKSRRGLDRVLDEAGLRPHFVYTRCADESRTKPHPQMLHDILDFTAIATHNAIMVGDTSYDMDMAHSASVAGLAVSYGVHSRNTLEQTNAESIVHSFDEVMAWLDRKGLEEAFS
jgi:phosphoglycolate phosphatase